MVSQADLQALMATGLKTYFHDPFLASEHITTAVTQTGAVTLNLAQALVATGVQSWSEARANYDREYFNPLYSKLYFKARLNDIDAVTLFMGFKSTLAAPAWGMTETCAGILIDGKNAPKVPYFYTASGSNYQATPILGMDMTRWLTYEIDGFKFRYYSLPYTVPYFDENVLPGIKQGIIRKWSGITTNGSTFPDDTMHYIVFYVKNHTGFNKYVELQFVNYAEVYPD